MINIKVTSAAPHLPLKLNEFISKTSPDLNDFKFYIDDPSIKKADFWFILDNLTEGDNFCFVPRQNIILLQGETIFPKNFLKNNNKFKNFYNQFSHIYSFINVKSENSSIPYLPWMINGNHASSNTNSVRDYDYFANLSSLPKPHIISVICSAKRITTSQKKRLNFVRYLKKNLGSDLHWYGNGVNPIDQKYKAIFPYKYHIVLENQSASNVITEKLFDSFLGLSFPIYWGAKNIFDFFLPNSLEIIDINDPRSSLTKIYEIISNHSYEENTNILFKSKQLVLTEYNLVQRIIKIVNQLKHEQLGKEKITLNPIQNFNFFERINLRLEVKKI